MKYRPKLAPAQDLKAVEPMVRAIYDRIYGPTYWDQKDTEVRDGITSFVVESARAGASRCIAHRQSDGTPHYLDPTDVLAALANAVTQEGH